MNSAFLELSDSDLTSLVSGLRSKRITAPYRKIQIDHFVHTGLSDTIVDGFNELELLGFSSEQVATTLELILEDRKKTNAAGANLELVTSGPEAPGIANRDTRIVVRDLFAHAEKSVLVFGYAIYQGKQVFKSLADRMEELPDLDVKMFLNISRRDGETTTSNIIVSRFRNRFIGSQWPEGCRLPEVYYDPRSVSDDERVRSSLHAKCVVVDREKVFISSANFTEAAQERNIEMGLRIGSEGLGNQITRHFDLLLDGGLAKRAF